MPVKEIHTSRRGTRYYSIPNNSTPSPSPVSPLSLSLCQSSGLRPHAENVGRNEICGQRVLIDCKYLHSRRRVYTIHMYISYISHTRPTLIGCPGKRVLKAFCHLLKLEQVLRGDQCTNILK